MNVRPAQSRTCGLRRTAEDAWTSSRRLRSRIPATSGTMQDRPGRKAGARRRSKARRAEQRSVGDEGHGQVEAPPSSSGTAHRILRRPGSSSAGRRHRGRRRSRRTVAVSRRRGHRRGMGTPPNGSIRRCDRNATAFVPASPNRLRTSSAASGYGTRRPSSRGTPERRLRQPGPGDCDPRPRRGSASHRIHVTPGTGSSAGSEAMSTTMISSKCAAEAKHIAQLRGAHVAEHAERHGRAPGHAREPTPRPSARR